MLAQQKSEGIIDASMILRCSIRPEVSDVHVSPVGNSVKTKKADSAQIGVHPVTDCHKVFPYYIFA